MQKYRFLWSNAHQLFYMVGNIDSYRKYSNIPFNKADVFQVSEGNLMSCYLAEDDLNKSVEEGELFLDKQKAKRYIDDALEQCARHRDFFKKLKQENLSRVSDAELLVYWRGLIDNYAHSVAYFRSTQEEPSRKIVATVTDKVTPDEAALLLMSTELDEINTEEVDWEILVKEGFTDEKALLHLARYPWLFQNTMTYQETVNELRQRLDGYISRDIHEEKRHLALEQARLLERYPFISEYINVLHQLALLRPEVKACWASTGYYATPLLQEISRRKGVDINDLTFLYRSEDVDNLLEKDVVLTKKDIEDRKLCTAYELVDGVLTSHVGMEALSVKERTLGLSSQSQVSELKGSTARPGKVTGRVRILKVNDPEATKEFRELFTEGVLVTSMTQPNVVDIARRASAIITDEGGMLCHAAIISREFGIPCVVGTHTATQVLKDGDLVEVDADNGVVRIIK